MRFHWYFYFLSKYFVNSSKQTNKHEFLLLLIPSQVQHLNQYFTKYTVDLLFYKIFYQIQCDMFSDHFKVASSPAAYVITTSYLLFFVDFVVCWWMFNRWITRGKIRKLQYIAFVNTHDINTPTTANLKIPTWCHWKWCWAKMYKLGLE